MTERATTDFFERQDQARSKTLWLIVLFAIAVLMLSLGTYVALAFLLNPEAVAFVAEPEIEPFFDFELFGVAIVVTGAFIAIGSLWKTSALKKGGSVVAEELGGREVDASTSDPLIRRYVNVVEEMSLASGVPVPKIYVLENEPGINAFAAGFTQNDAAVAVTRGALEQLTRDELQGVVAHEFSHILNGDMRLNIRLIGIIHGIVLMYITGRILLRAMGRGGRRRGKGAAALLAAGLVLLIAGLGGILCGRLIKSAISRQREYLADSAAVQFTRNPDGLAGALKKIGGFTHGSSLESDQAEEVSHICFGNVASKGMMSKLTGGLMSTHPPVEKRIKAIDPSFNPDQGFERLDAETRRAQLESEPPSETAGADRSAAGGGAAAAAAASGLAGGGAATATGTRTVTESDTGAGSAGGADEFKIDADEVLDNVGRTDPERLVYCSTLLEEIPRPLMEARSDLMGAIAIVYTLLLDEDDHERQKQGQMLEQYADPKVVEETRRLWPAIGRLDQEYRLPLMDLLIPTLRRMTEEQYREFSEMVDRLIQADDRVSFKEFVLEQVVLHRLELALHDADRNHVQYRSFSDVDADIENVLSALIFVGHDDPAVAEKAYEEGRARLPRSIREDIGFRGPNDWTFEDVGESLERLSVASPTIKKAVVDACAYCVMGDGRVVVEESEMLRATCEVLDVPLPPFIPAATSRTGG